MHTITVEEFDQQPQRLLDGAQRGVPALVNRTPCPFVEPAVAVLGE